MSLHHLTRPAALQEGDCIGLAAPASPFDKQALLAGIAKLNANITLSGNLTLDFYTGIEIWGGNNQIICQEEDEGRDTERE